MGKDHDDAPVANYELRALPARSAYTPLFSPRMDSLAFVAPIIVAFALIPTLWTIPTDSVPRWAWVPLVLCVDVAHVWSTVFRTYLDRRELLRRPSLYMGVPVGVFVGGFALHRVGGSQCFWTANSYIAIHHFVKQDLGLLFLFIARFGQRLSKRQLQREKAALYLGALCPLLLWHAEPPDAFHWFRANERFVFTLPAACLPPVIALYVATALAYVCGEVARWRRGEPPNVGKLYIMAASWLTWLVGSLCKHEVVTLGFLNLFHGVPYMIMVGTYCRRRWANLEPASCGDALTRWLTRHWCTFLLVLVALAVVEELLWDALVFQDYLPSLCRNMTAASPGSEAAAHGGLHFSSRFGGRGSGHTYQAGERSPRRGGGWLCDRLWGEEGDASMGEEGEEEGELPLLDFEATGIALFTAALATPQIVHYVLDGYIWRFDLNPRLREYLFAGEAPGAGAGEASGTGAAGDGAHMAEAKEGKGESFHRPDSHPPLTAEQIAAAAAAWRAARRDPS